jgi:hypothetical protein
MLRRRCSLLDYPVQKQFDIPEASCLMMDRFYSEREKESFLHLLSDENVWMVGLFVCMRS